MALSRSTAVLQRVGSLEIDLCERLNRTCRRPWMQRYFATISRLGDGPFWYALMLLLPLIYGAGALQVSGAMVVTALFGLACYKLLKQGITRARPYAVDRRIVLGTEPLDQFSFPSGHTLHAVSFSTISIDHYPSLGWLLVPFTLLVALSRVLLGLHYPSDVLAGALLGGVVASLCLAVL
ncbi:MAG: undecaprenyl-diphosphatase [Motiliproteus sp.]|jgi:undecaprenyl-diphosphatase